LAENDQSLAAKRMISEVVPNS